MSKASYSALVIAAIRKGQTREGFDQEGHLVIALRDGDRLVPLATLVITPPMLAPPEPIAA